MIPNTVSATINIQDPRMLFKRSRHIFLPSKHFYHIPIHSTQELLAYYVTSRIITATFTVTRARLSYFSEAFHERGLVYCYNKILRCLGEHTNYSAGFTQFRVKKRSEQNIFH